MSVLEVIGKVGAHRERCITAGNCVLVAPRFFSQGEIDGVVELLQEEYTAADEEMVLEAVDVCPVAALFVAPSKF